MAANDSIKIQRDQTAATEAAELLLFKNTVRTAYELGIRIRAKMQHNFSDAGGENSIDWTAVQTLWGIPTNGDDVGPEANGKIVFTFVDGLVLSLEGGAQTNAGKELSERIV